MKQFELAPKIPTQRREGLGLITFKLKPELMESYQFQKRRLGYTTDEFLNSMVEFCLEQLSLKERKIE